MLLRQAILLLTGNFKIAFCQLKKVMVSLIANLSEIIFLYVLFTLIFCQYDHTHWNGIEEKEDDTFKKKFFNRLYFTSTTYSTVGYGDISPKTPSCRNIAIILQTFIIIELVNLALHVKPGQ